MKTIKAMQIESVKAEDVKPGYVMPEGVVLSVTEQDEFVFFNCPYSSPWAERGYPVNVICTVTPEATETFAELYSATTHRADTRHAT